MSANFVKNNFIIGLTGGISSGKSTTFNYFVKKGFFGIDCDHIVDKLYRQSDVLKGYCLKEFKTLEKSEIAKIVFNDKKKRESLESLVHPLVLDEIDNIINNLNGELIIIDMPLLFEINYQDEVDLTILVYVNEETQKNRLIDRSTSNNELLDQIIYSQMPLEIKKNLADYIIDNNDSIVELHKKIDKVIREVKNEIN